MKHQLLSKLSLSLKLELLTALQEDSEKFIEELSSDVERVHREFTVIASKEIP